ncbi:hypothetical protein [Nocardia asteroides]|uniref:hypothetical protein n=1 Tax=Nocardia asteroides TaxID=1824 RepID=UPI001E3FD9B6|nr:hypothetical protein [Nocardia asteroides]UGT60344.1 hypothetical protein LTT61_24560 [Nocardia asteroides]
MVQIGARPEQLGMVRVLTLAIGFGLGLGIDEAADLELVVNEIAAVLVAVAVPEAVVRYEYCQEATLLRVYISARARAEPVPGGLGWHIVRALATDVVIDYDHFGSDPGGQEVRVGFTWGRSPD